MIKKLRKSIKGLIKRCKRKSISGLVTRPNITCEHRYGERVALGNCPIRAYHMMETCIQYHEVYLLLDSLKLKKSVFDITEQQGENEVIIEWMYKVNLMSGMDTLAKGLK